MGCLNIITRFGGLYNDIYFEREKSEVANIYNYNFAPPK